MSPHRSTAPSERLWGAGELSALFPGSPIALVPWPRAPRRKDRPLYDAAEVAAALARPPRLVTVDPRRLFATQSRVLSHHVRYYLEHTWHCTGRTSADQHLLANQYPLVVADPDGRLLLLGGHHRAAAAVLRGRRLPVRLVPASNAGAIAVLPGLLVDETSAAAAEPVTTPTTAARRIRRGDTVRVATLTQAEAALEHLDLGDEERRERLALARTGRLISPTLAA